MIKYIDRAQDNDGNALAADVLVVDHTTGLPASLFDDDGVTPVSNPVTAEANGLFSFKIEAGLYDLSITKDTFVLSQNLVTIIDDPSISYLINDDVGLEYGDLVYISGDSEVKKAVSTDTPAKAGVYAVCLEDTLDSSDVGRFRTFGAIDRTGTPGLLGYLGQDSKITEIVPDFENGDLQLAVLGRQLSASQFLFRSPLASSAMYKEAVVIPDGWYGDAHGFRWGSGDADDWTDNELYYQYTHPEGGGEVDIKIAKVGGAPGIGITCPGVGSSSGSSFGFITISEPGVYLFLVYVDGQWVNDATTSALENITYTVYKDDVEIDNVIAKRRGHIWKFENFKGIALDTPFVHHYGDTIDSFKPGPLEFEIVANVSINWSGSVSFTGDDFIATGMFVFVVDGPQFVNTSIQATPPAGPDITVTVGLARTAPP